MRVLSFFFVGGLVIAASESAPARQTQAVAAPGAGAQGGACTSDLTAVGADLLQTGISLWSGIQFCKTIDDGNKDTAIACVADIGGVMASLTNVGQYIISVIESCIGRTLVGDDCAKRSLILAGAVSQTVGSATSISNGCQTRAFRTSQQNYTKVLSGASCMVDVRGAMQGLMTSIGSFAQVKQMCAVSPEQCVSYTSHIIASLASVAKFVLSACGDCIHKLPPGSACGVEITTLVQSLTTIVAAGVQVEQTCKPHVATKDGFAEPKVSLPPIGGTGIFAHLMGKAAPKPAEPAAARLLTSAKALTPEEVIQIADMKKTFSAAQRLFQTKEQSSDKPQSVVEEKQANTTPLLLAFLPVTAIMGFLAGKRAGSRTGTAHQECPQEELQMTE